MGKHQQQKSLKNYLPWVGILVVALIACILKAPEPELNWDGFVLPMTNRYAATKNEKMPLQGVNVVISGATSGIGRGMVEAMVKLGASVIAMGRNEAKLQQLQQDCLFGQGSLVRTVVADYNDLESVSKAAEEIQQLTDGRVDILLNNAGMHEGIVLWEDPVSKQGYDRIFSVNYLAHFLLTEKLAPSLKNSERRPIVAQMSSSFHWLGDWTDLRPTTSLSSKKKDDGSSPPPAPPASWKGGPGGFVFRTQRGYADSKLAMIFHAKALKRRNPDLEKSRIVSICPGWVATNIMPNPIGSAVINKLGFRHNGWGIASALYAMFAEEDGHDYFSNTRALNPVAIYHKWPYAEITHHPWTFALGIRDFGALISAFMVLAVQKFMPIAEPGLPSPVTYDEDKQDQLYDWSKKAVAEWL